MSSYRAIYPDPPNPNLVRYSNDNSATIKVYDPNIHSITIDQEPDFGWGSPSAAIQYGINSSDDNSGWHCSSGIAVGPTTQLINFDVTFSQLALYPVSLFNIYIRASGYYEGRAAWSGQLIEPILYFKKSINTQLPEDVFITSGLINGDYYSWTNNRFENGTWSMPAPAQNSSPIYSGLPSSYPSLSGQLRLMYNGNARISEMMMDFYGDAPASSGALPLYIVSASSVSTTGIPLYTKGKTSFTSGITLYCQQSTSYNNLDLFLKSFDQSSGSLPLFISAGYSADDFPLYTWGSTSVTSGIPLFISGSGKATYLSLYTSGTSPFAESGYFPLFTYSTTNSGLYKSLPLYLKFADDYPDRRQSLPLYVTGPASTQYSGSMILYLKSSNEVTNTLPLYLSNNWLNYSGYLPLFMNAPSGTQGAIPFSGYMPLYINRGNDSLAAGLGLFAKSFDRESGVLNLYTFGAPTSTSGIPMYTKGTSTLFASLPTYTHGF